MAYPFFAMLARMKHINRWGLMRNTRAENIQEHSLQVAVVAHALALIKDAYYGGGVDANEAAVAALFHDCDEILTGDLPTPVKYFNESIRSAYREVEDAAAGKLLSMLPEAMRPAYSGLLRHDARPGVWRVVKAADTICAHIKCLEELATGNTEFTAAAASTRQKIADLGMPEADRFMEDYAGAFSLSLDEFGL